MDSKNVLLIVLVVVIIGIAAYCYMNSNSSKKEHYKEVFLTGGYNDSAVQRPTFKANLAPRFDPYREGGGYIKGSFPDNYSVQSVGPNSLSKGEIEAAKQLDYATLGGENKMLSEYDEACKLMKRGEYKVAKEVALASMDYVEPKDLLPEPDMRSCVKDPTNPANYMYDRTLFAPLKQRTSNIPDRVRGDLNIAPIRYGWFDSPAVPGVDLAKGATQGFIADVMGPDMDLEDTSFFRVNPTMAVKEEIAKETLPFGAMQYHFL